MNINDLAIIVSSLSFVLKINIVTCNDCMDHAIGGELLLWCEGSRGCSKGGGGRLGSVLFWSIKLFGVDR
jgi:hypothetical protein